MKTDETVFADQPLVPKMTCPQDCLLQDRVSGTVDKEPRLGDQGVFHHQIMNEPVLTPNFSGRIDHQIVGREEFDAILCDNHAFHPRSGPHIDVAVGKRQHNPVFKLKGTSAGNGWRCEKQTDEK